MKEVLARYRNPRSSKLRWIVIHVNVGPENIRAAESVARYCQQSATNRGGSTGGYHELIDNQEVIIGARPNEMVAGASGANDQGYHICLIGYADQSAEQWADAYSTAELRLAAGRVREACSRFGIPREKINGAQMRNGVMGVAGHVDVRDAWQKTSHYDPGPNFPWSKFMALVNGGAPPEEEDDDVAKAVLVYPEKTLKDGTRPTVLTELGSRQGTKLNKAEAKIQIDSGLERVELPMAMWRLMVVRG